MTCQNANGAIINNSGVTSTDSKNCVQTGNNVLCDVPATDPKAQFCGTVNGVKQCFSSTAYQKNTAVATVTNADGSKTVTKTTTNNVVNGGQQTITEQYNAAGVLTSTSTTGTLFETPQASIGSGNQNSTSNNADVVAKLDEIKQGLSTKDTTAMPSNGSVRTFGESNDLLKSKFQQYLSVPSFSTSNAECPIFSQYIPFINKTLTIDQFCTMDPLIRPVLNVVSTGFWLLLGLLIIFRA